MYSNRILIAVIVLMMAACSNWEPARCSDGKLCPPGTRCAADQDVCIATCGDGIIDERENEICDDGNIIIGDGCDNLCLPEGCGNSILNPREVCDDGNLESGDGCSAACRSEFCGNSTIDREFGETCDDGNKDSGDDCNSYCLEEYCGNGIVDRAKGEACDDGNHDNGDGCSATCASQFCGNGSLDSSFGEQCDDGNTEPGDNCSAACQYEVCGNDFVDPGEGCDDGNTAPGDGCSAECLSEFCGNGRMDPGEECDDGNTNPGDGCSALCRDEECGNGIKDAGEGCDDGNTNPGDGCSAECRSEYCGNGIEDTALGETCDDGNTTAGDGCSALCQAEGCGNGILDPGEECDDGDTDDADDCPTSCQEAFCGDGFVHRDDETCDDGNGDITDACPDGPSGTCEPAHCGDGFIVPGSETCDDGDGLINDECPDGPGGTCEAARCGDGIIRVVMESCDDGNQIPGDGCENDCTPTPTGPIAIAAGGYHTCVVLNTSTVRGAVRCWGYNEHGQLGYGHDDEIGDNEVPSTAGDVDVGGPVKALAAGLRHTCALLESGKVRCWGLNFDGQLGYGHTVEIGDNEVPSTAGDVDVGGPVKALAAGLAHTCALLESGKVRCWGQNDWGQLGYGNNNKIGDNEVPSTAGDVNVGGTVAALATGAGHTCALLESGKVRCWGANTSGQLGYGHIDNIGDNELPFTAGDVNVGGTVTSLALGGGHTCALLESGKVRCWGSNGSGRLGYGHINNIGDNELPFTAGDVNVGGTVTSLALGTWHTCARLATGAVRCWGANNYGQLGYGHVDDIGDNELPSAAGDVDVGGTVTLLASSTWHTCALLATRAVRCWGLNDYGQLGYGHTNRIGDNELPSSAAPVRILDPQ